MGPWGGLGSPWESSWKHFGSQGRPGEQKGDKPRFVGPPWGPQGSPFGDPFFDMFRYLGVFLSRFFEALFWRLLGSIFCMDLGCFLVVFFDVFLLCVLERPSLRRMSF